jgi:GT2 family glycosyltransferase
MIKTVLIIPFYNHAQPLLAGALRSALATVGDDVAVVVVDDSKDPAEREACAAIVKQAGGRADLLVNERNNGFLQTTKRGADYAMEKWPEAEFLMFYNSDLAATGWGWHEAMLEAFEDPKVAVCGAKLVFPAGPGEKHRLQHAGVSHTDGGWPFHPYCSDGMGYAGELEDFPAANVFRKDIHAVTGGCFMVRAVVWDLLGGWDDAFGRGVFEDVDFCWRAIAQGYLVAYQPEACFIHHQSASREADGSHSLHDNSGPNGVILRQKHAGIKSDEPLFGGKPRSAEEAEKSAIAAAAARSGKVLVTLQLDEKIGSRLVPMMEMARAGHGLSEMLIKQLQMIPDYTQRNQLAQQILEIAKAISRRGRREELEVNASTSLKAGDMSDGIRQAQAKVRAQAQGSRKRHGAKKAS